MATTTRPAPVTTAITGNGTGTEARRDSTVDVATTSRRPLWRVAVASGAVAAAATTLTAVVARAAGVDLAISGEEIPLAGFPQLTMVGALLGLVLAKVLASRVRRARTMFVRVTVALTALSIVPDLTIEATAASKVVLIFTHLLAAAIVVPALASRLRR